MGLGGFIVLVLIVGGIWLGAMLIFGMLRARYHAKHAESLRYITVKMPRTDGDHDKANDSIQSMKQNIEVMSQIFKNCTALYSKSFMDRHFGQPYIVCEMLVEKEIIKFNMAFPQDFVETFEKGISSFFPGAVIDPIPYPKLLDAGKFVAGGHFVLSKDNALPIKTYENFEADPMDSTMASFARVGIEEKLCFQILIAPLSDSRQHSIRKRVEQIKSGKQDGLFSFLKDAFRDPKKDDAKGPDKQSEYSSSQLGDIEKKAIDEGFSTIMRGIAISPLPDRPEKMMKDLERSLDQYNYTGLNAIDFRPESGEHFLQTFLLRAFTKPIFKRREGLTHVRSQILNIKELASLFHFPHNRYNKNPRIRRQKFKIVPAPDNLSKEGILLGTNLYAGVKKEVRLGFDDRFRHVYIIGQTGTGKSTALRTMINQDMPAGYGFTLIDPHGDLAEGALEYFPKERINDLIYRDAANMELPFGFNFLEAKNEREMDLVTNDAVDMFVKLFGSEIFGPRIQDYFRNGVLALMEQPDGGSLIEIVRLFTDQAYQKVKLKNVTNPVVRAWREKTYNSMGDREKAEMIPYFQAKFGPFTTTPILRNIIGQTKSSFDIGEVMDSGKILIMNLSKGKMGDVNADLLGMMIVSQVRLAAFRRADIPEKQRVPHFLYIDEFQNFVTPAIESILSEARKYRLGLVIAHQYMGQLTREGTSSKGAVNLKDPVLGNVGNMMSYRIGVDDTEILERQFAPNFSATDLMNLDKFKAVVKLSVDMQPTPAFSMTLKLPWEDPKINNEEKVAIIKQISALKYGRKKELVDKEIYYRVGV